MCLCIPDRTGIWQCWFFGEGKTGENKLKQFFIATLKKPWSNRLCCNEKANKSLTRQECKHQWKYTGIIRLVSGF